jgi:hypothetical protein
MRIARPKGDYVLEFANKHNMKAMLRFWLRRQTWSPFTQEPVEFAEMNFDFHPAWMRQQLEEAGFIPGRTLAVSHFRIPVLKQVVPNGLLSGLDRFLQPTGSWIKVAPSIFVHNQVGEIGTAAPAGNFFACPHCRTALGDVIIENQLVCPNPDCGRIWAVSDGLYDFKEPVGKIDA